MAQTTRLLRCECPQCGFLARITRRWIDYGLPECACGGQWQVAAVDLAAYRELSREITAADACDSWQALRAAIMREAGGIRTNADYPAASIPRELIRRNGLPADEIPLLLESVGYHFEDAAALISACWTARDAGRRLAA